MPTPVDQVVAVCADQLLSHFRALSDADKESFLSTVGGPRVEETGDATMPTKGQLFKYFVVTTIPYIGFGFADNFLMLIFGEQLEIFFGSSLHLSTLAAAGLGNLMSDVFGIGLGGVIERCAEALGIPPHEMTLEQLNSGRAKAVYGSGAVAGITFGCLLGMCPLLNVKGLLNECDVGGEANLDGSEFAMAFQTEEFGQLINEFGTE